MKKIIYIFTIFLSISNCKLSNNDELIYGGWELIENNSKENTLPELNRICSINGDWYCNDKIYFSEKTVEFPFGFSKPKEEFESNFLNYEIQNNIISFDGKEDSAMEINYSNDKLILGDNEFIFKRDKNEFSKIDSTFLRFKIYNDEELSLDFSIDKKGSLEFHHSSNLNSIAIKIKRKDIEYLYALLGRIEKADLNRIYNLDISHCEEYEFGFVHQDGSWYEIKTCSFKSKQPFEIKAVIFNIHKLLEKYGK